MGWKLVALTTFLLVFCIGIVATGGVLCWLSTIKHTCNDWSTKSPYFPLYECGYSHLDIIASSKCKTECFCEKYFEYECIDHLPGGASMQYITGGVIMIVFGIIAIIFIIFIIFKMIV